MEVLFFLFSNVGRPHGDKKRFYKTVIDSRCNHQVAECEHKGTGRRAAEYRISRNCKLRTMDSVGLGDWKPCDHTH